MWSNICLSAKVPQPWLEMNVVARVLRAWMNPQPSTQPPILPQFYATTGLNETNVVCAWMNPRPSVHGTSGASAVRLFSHTIFLSFGRSPEPTAHKGKNGGWGPRRSRVKLA